MDTNLFIRYLSIPAFIKELNGQYVDCNTAFVKLTEHHSKKDIQGRTDAQLLWKQKSLRTDSCERIVSEQKQAITVNKELFWLHLLPLETTDNGVITSVLGLYIDNQKYLHEIENQLFTLEEIISLLPGHVYWKDINCILQGCNNEQAYDVGLNSYKNIKGKTVFDLLMPNQPEEERKKQALITDNIDKEIMKEDTPQTVEEFTIGRDGSVINWLSKKVPLHDRSGKVTGIAGISLDITELKKTQQELIQAKQKAEEANELKSKFIQNMQHDIRTPLSGLYGYMKDLAEEETDPEKKQFAKYMAAAAGQLLNMCNELVDFENIDYLGDTTKLESVDILRFLSKVIDLNRVAAHHRGLQLNLSIDPAVPARLKLDKKKLFRVLVNLIGNSLKFTDEGSVSLHAKLISSTREMATVAFEILDTGMGIPADKIKHIFDKFVRLNPSNQAKYKGSGLGLYYVKKFVDDMGGTLEVESVENKGSTFRVILTLPLPNEHEKEEMVPHEIDTFDEETILQEIDKFPDDRFKKQKKPIELSLAQNDNLKMSTEGKPQLLLIEDDIILQRTIGKTFIDKGCDIVAKADSVSTAREAIKARRYDLVVCDLGIHEGTGIDVMNWVKSDKTHPNQATPFVVLTANNDNEVKQKALKSGFLDVFQKPLDPVEAQKIIDTYIHIKTASKPSTQIINVDASLAIADNDKELVKEVFEMLSQSILKDKEKLQRIYEENNIAETRHILSRLNGSFSYCVVPKLQKARDQLDIAVQHTQKLTAIKSLYDNFFQEIEHFETEYAKLKNAGKL